MIEKTLSVETPLGTLTAYPSGGEPDNPGICIDFIPKGTEKSHPVALVETTGTEWDLLSGNHLITRVWQDITEDDFSVRVLHEAGTELIDDEMWN